ncbi:MAG: ubiquinone/menaquinone biosynthesis methyltransferase [Polyangiaceae bacterium]|nr:ubiquinone/menaquinone biosynthesis methyltransferase [Polyangiaceae bacterium]
MFDGIARRYDALNRVMSLGLDPLWRRATVRALGLVGARRALDVATGTADLAIAMARSAPELEVVGVDPSREMRTIGLAKIAEARLTSRVRLREGECERLPFGDGEFDAVGISFGIRNVPDRAAGLAELARVARPGARVVVLELAEPRGALSPLSRLYVHRVVPLVGGAVSGSDEYAYLARSIAAFPPRDEFARMMERAGLRVREVRPMTFGVVTLYVGEKARA